MGILAREAILSKGDTTQEDAESAVLGVGRGTNGERDRPGLLGSEPQKGIYISALTWLRKYTATKKAKPL